MKRISFCLSLVLTGLFISFNIRAQEQYLPGYIIRTNGDTLKGYIDYRNWKTNPKTVEFKTGKNSEPVLCTPSNTKEFSVKEEIYVGASVNIETSPRKAEELNADAAIHLEPDTVFLQTLIKGKKSLYYYYRQEKDYFYIGKESGYELLVLKRYLTDIESGEGKINEIKKYTGQLYNYLNDCPEIEPRITTLEYKTSSMTSLFNFYYKCSRNKMTFQKSSDKLKIETGVLAGASMTTLTFSGSKHEEFIQADFDPSVSYAAGLFFDFVLPRNQGKWSVYNELLLSNYDVTASYTDFVSADNYTVTDSEFGYTHLKMNNMVRFKYPVGKTYIFVNGGISNGYFIRETNTKTVFKKFYTDETTVEEVAISDSRKYEHGFVAGAGLRTWKLSLEARFETGNGMSKFLDLSSKTKRIYLLLGFRF